MKKLKYVIGFLCGCFIVFFAVKTFAHKLTFEHKGLPLIAGPPLKYEDPPPLPAFELQAPMTFVIPETPDYQEKFRRRDLIREQVEQYRYDQLHQYRFNRRTSKRLKKLEDNVGYLEFSKTPSKTLRRSDFSGGALGLASRTSYGPWRPLSMPSSSSEKITYKKLENKIALLEKAVLNLEKQIKSNCELEKKHWKQVIKNSRQIKQLLNKK